MKKSIYLLVLSILYFMPSIVYTQNIGLKIGDIAPEIIQKNLEGNTISLSSLRGKVVLIYFWQPFAAESVSCPETIKLIDIYNIYKSKTFKNFGNGFTIFSICLNDDLGWWGKCSKRDGINWVANGMEKSKCYVRYDGYRINKEVLPVTYLIDKDGIIISKNLSGTLLEQKISSLENGEREIVMYESKKPVKNVKSKFYKRMDKLTNDIIAHKEGNIFKEPHGKYQILLYEYSVPLDGTKMKLPKAEFIKYMDDKGYYYQIKSMDHQFREDTVAYVANFVFRDKMEVNAAYNDIANRVKETKQRGIEANQNAIKEAEKNRKIKEAKLEQEKKKIENGVAILTVNLDLIYGTHPKFLKSINGIEEEVTYENKIYKVPAGKVNITFSANGGVTANYINPEFTRTLDLDAGCNYEINFKKRLPDKYYDINTNIKAHPLEEEFQFIWIDCPDVDILTQIKRWNELSPYFNDDSPPEFYEKYLRNKNPGKHEYTIENIKMYWQNWSSSTGSSKGALRYEGDIKVEIRYYKDYNYYDWKRYMHGKGTYYLGNDQLTGFWIEGELDDSKPSTMKYSNGTSTTGYWIYTGNLTNLGGLYRSKDRSDDWTFLGSDLESAINRKNALINNYDQQSAELTQKWKNERNAQYQTDLKKGDWYIEEDWKEVSAGVFATIILDAKSPGKERKIKCKSDYGSDFVFIYYSNDNSKYYVKSGLSSSDSFINYSDALAYALGKLKCKP